MVQFGTYILTLETERGIQSISDSIQYAEIW